ncbi:Dual specificity protein phosphatase 4 [Mactra antiquata]
MEVHNVTPSCLTQLLDSQAQKILLLDCRSFVAFNAERIEGAVHIFFPSILKRRLAVSGSLMLEQLLKPEIRKRLRNGEYKHLVLYDNEGLIKENSDVSIITQGLKRNSYNFKCVLILKGGFHTFKAKYPRHCVKQRTGGDSVSVDTTTKLVTQTFISTTTNESKTNPTQLMPHLYIGDETHSNNVNLLRKLDITAILNVSNVTCPDHISRMFEYKCIPIRDNVSENISTWFSEALQFIESVRLREGKVLVHCKAGISRSATICIAYLMSYKSLTLDQAFDYVRARREVISPNMNFMQQLFEFERKLLVSRMRSFVYPSVSELSPLTCAQTTEKSPGIGTNCFNFSMCAVSQI